MRVGSLFSGIGGLEYGLERAELSTSCEWMIEMDDFCCSILEKNFPNTLIINDKVENINPLDLPKIDILTAGFPCQPVSTAGSRKGVKDERWLWDEVWRFIDVLRPQYFILENVPGLFTANKGEAFERVIKDIAKSRSYRFEWQIVSARTVGAAHLRKRFFGVGTLLNTESKSSNETDQSPSTISQSRETRLNIGAGYRGEKSRADREKAELWMGSTAYGFPGWMARLGIRNVWQHTLDNFPTAAARDWKDTYGTVLTGSISSKRRTLPLEIFRQIRDTIKDFALWEYGMPRSAGDYPKRKEKLMALGNAVVPQCAELVGRMIKRSNELGTLVFDIDIKNEN
jgi:site-specific DNA-cytosine methylase